VLVAYEAGVPAGFVSGVETIQPDKGTEMFLYELAVDPAHRGRGIGRALVDALAEVARSAGCYGMWVATDEDNAAALARRRGCYGMWVGVDAGDEPALATYRRARADEEATGVVLAWNLPAER